MKQLFLFLLASLLYIGGASAQSSNIPLKQGPPKSVGGSRTVVQLPTATIISKGGRLKISNGKIK